VQKTSDIAKFMVCPHGQASADILPTRREGRQFFAILCGRSLWTAHFYAILILIFDFLKLIDDTKYFR